MLTAEGVAVEPHPWLPDCLFLNGTGSLEHLEAFQKGYFYIQDAAAHLAVLAAANLFLLYTGTRPGENSPQPLAWRAVARDLAGLDTQAQQDFINEKLDLVSGVLQIDQILSYQAVGGYLGVDVRQEYADLFAQYEQAYQDKDYQLYTGDLLVEYGFLSQLKAELDTVAGYPQFLEDVQAKAKQARPAFPSSTPAKAATTGPTSTRPPRYMRAWET